MHINDYELSNLIFVPISWLTGGPQVTVSLLLFQSHHVPLCYYTKTHSQRNKDEVLQHSQTAMGEV